MNKDKKEQIKERRNFHEELEGFDIKVNAFGELESSFDIDKINEFLNEQVDDKKMSHTDPDSATSKAGDEEE